MLWRGAVRHAHKDPVFPQRRQRQTHCSGASFFFLQLFFFPNSNYYHTRATWWIVTCHQGIRRAAWKYDIIRISDDCAWPGCYFVKYFLFISSFHTWLPFSHSDHALGWNFPCQRMENIFADLSSGFFGSGSVQLNADLNPACSLELTHTAAPTNSSVSQEPVLKPKPLACYLRSLVLKLWNSRSPVSPLNHV